MLRNILRISNVHKPLLFNVTRNFKNNEATNAVPEVDQPNKNVVEELTKKSHVNPFASPSFKVATEQKPVASPEEQERRLKVLKLELDIANQEGRRVPQLSFMQAHHWNHVLSLPTKSARNKYYGFLWQIEKKQESKLRKKEERAVAVIERKEELRKQREECDHIIYGLGHTSLFLRIYDSTVNLWQNNRLSRAMQFASKVVLDCGYDEHMTKREAQNAAKQLMLCFAENRMHDEPLDLHFCNINMNSVSMDQLQRYIPTMLQPEFPMNVHDKCFTEIFPKNQLVYLTPHCQNDLVEFNHDDVYIIGAMVDTVNNEPLSLARAKRLGLRMARLPLDQYLQWGAGSGKSLTLNQMIKILLDLRDSGDWMHALRHVPRRKIMDSNYNSFRLRNSKPRRDSELSLRLDKLLDFELDRREVNAKKDLPQNKKSSLKFNLDTWASNKKT